MSMQFNDVTIDIPPTNTDLAQKGLQDYVLLKLLVLNFQGQKVCWEDGKQEKPGAGSMACPLKSDLSW